MKTKTKADWLRSEIEKLEGIFKPTMIMERSLTTGGGYPDSKAIGFNQAITSIITRYKEELLELEKGDN